MASRTIILKGKPIRKEALAGNASITPGYLIEFFGDANVADVVIPHTTSTGAAAKRFALEDDPVAGEIGTAYTSGSRVQMGVFSPGDEVYAFLVAAATVARGAFLESNGDGDLRLVSGTDQQPVGVALEDVDLTASGDVSTAIKIEIV